VAESVKRITAVLFGGSGYSSLASEDFKQLTNELPVAEASIGDGYVTALVATGLAGSNSEARRFIEQGGVYVNGEPITLEAAVATKDAVDGMHIIVRRGKNSNAILKLLA
jgi:tyrosyl-tRNA synthetase